MKRIIHKLWMALTMLCLSISASAFDFEVNGFQYNIVSLADNTAELVSSTNDDCGDLIIPSTVTYGNRDIKIISIGKGAFKNNKLTTLSCGLYLKSICSMAFSSCNNLKKVTLSEATDSLSAAFSDCTNLEEITFKSNYCFVDGATFQDCCNLKIVNIPSIKAWTKYTFNNPLFLDCKSATLYVDGTAINRVNLPIGLTELKPYTFAALRSLTDIVIPSTLTKFGKESLAGTGITNLVIPNSCDTICEAAFQGLQLDQLSIPPSVKFIEKMGGSFYAYGDLTIGKLIIEESSDTLTFENASSFMDRCTFKEFHWFRPIQGLLYKRIYQHNGKWITDAPTRTSSVFYNMEGLEKVVIGPLVGGMSCKTFIGCHDLTNLDIKDTDRPIIFRQDNGFTTERIGLTDYKIPIYYAEFGSSPLKEITIGRNIVYERDSLQTNYHESFVRRDVRPSPFNARKLIEKVTIGDFVTELPDKNLFANCPISYVSIGELLREIPEGSFSNDVNTLETIICHGNIPPKYSTGFKNYDYVNAIVHVPSSSLMEYKSAAPWSNFWNITDEEYSGLITSIIPDDISPIFIYDINGVYMGTSITGLCKGIYIVKCNNYTKKIIIR